MSRVTKREARELETTTPAARAAFKRGGNVGLLRYRMRLTQRALGELLGVSESTIIRWEKARVVTSSWHLQLMRKISKIDDYTLEHNAGYLGVFGPIETLARLMVEASR